MIRFALILTVTALATAFVGCASHRDGITARGTFAGVSLQTSVDSEIAKHYLQSTLTGDETHHDWDSRIDALHLSFGGRIPTTDELREISQSFSVDFAALFLARQLQRASESDPIAAAYREGVVSAKSGNPLLLDSESPQRHLFVFVLGWLYLTDPSSGADLHRQREVIAKMGASVALIPTLENNTVEDNAALIALELKNLARKHDSFFLVSASKGGPETGLALAMLRDWPPVKKIEGWINIGGTMRGTALADLALTWPACWFAWAAILPDSSFDGIRSLSTSESRRRFDKLVLPDHLRVVNFLGIPLSGQVSTRAWDGYIRLMEHGPNDGITLLTDAVVPGGSTIVELGADHFFALPDIELRTAVLARVVARMRQADAQQGAPADRPASASLRQDGG